MSAAWVAGSVRARAIARRRLGSASARTLAAAPSSAAAIESLAGSAYGSAGRGADSVSDATHAVAETLLWNVRVLAGWLPSGGAEVLRRLAGWYEIANVEQHLRGLAGQPAATPFALGSLAIAWPRLARTRSTTELRAALAASVWGDPGGVAPRDVQLSMRLVWADRVTARVPAARPWALGAAALLVAREVLLRRQPLPATAAGPARRLLGARAVQATSMPDFQAALPGQAGWVLAGFDDVGELWRAEAGWWRRVREDSARLVAGPGFGPDRVVGAAGLLADDAWLVAGALEVAGRGPESVAVFDEMASR